MIWLFALGIIGFCLVHEGFRKVCFWLGGIVVLGIALISVTFAIQDQQKKDNLAQESAIYEKEHSCDQKPFYALKYSQCMAREDFLKSF